MTNPENLKIIISTKRRFFIQTLKKIVATSLVFVSVLAAVSSASYFNDRNPILGKAAPIIGTTPSNGGNVNSASGSQNSNSSDNSNGKEATSITTKSLEQQSQTTVLGPESGIKVAPSTQIESSSAESQAGNENGTKDGTEIGTESKDKNVTNEIPKIPSKTKKTQEYTKLDQQIELKNDDKIANGDERKSNFGDISIVIPTGTEISTPVKETQYQETNSTNRTNISNSNSNSTQSNIIQQAVQVVNRLSSMVGSLVGGTTQNDTNIEKLALDQSTIGVGSVVKEVETINKLTFDFGNKDKHLIFSSPVKISVATNLENNTPVEIKVKHLGDSDYNISGLISKAEFDSGVNCGVDGKAVSQVNTNQTDSTNGNQTNQIFSAIDNLITFYTCGASSFTITPSSGTATFTSPAPLPAPQTVFNTLTPTFTGTGINNGSTITLALNGDATILGTATVTSGQWSITPTTPLTPGSHTVCIGNSGGSPGNVGIIACTTFVACDSSCLTVTINQDAAQTDPTINSPVKFKVVFSQAIDVATFTPATILLSGSAPGKAVSSITEVAPNNGTTFDVLVSTTGYGTVIASILQPVTNYPSSILGTTSTATIGLTIDSSGNIYTANYSNNNVNKTTPSGISSVFGTTGSVPNGITIDSVGNLYISNRDSNNVTKITPAGISSIFGNTGSGPNGITIDLSGNIYTPNYNSNNVTKITPAGVSSILGTTGSLPYAIALDSTGNVYTPNANSNNVTKINQLVFLAF